MRFHQQRALAPVGKRPRFVEKPAVKETIEFNAQVPKGSIAELVQNRSRELLVAGPPAEDELLTQLTRVSTFSFAANDTIVIAPSGKRPKRTSYYCEGVDFGV